MRKFSPRDCPAKVAAPPYCCCLFTLSFILQTLIHANYPLTGTGDGAVKSE